MSDEALTEARRAIPLPTWDFFRASFEAAPSGRSEAWRQVGVWAVERLQVRLGSDWPERTWKRHGGLPGGMAYAISHTAAYFELIELALWLELLGGCDGFADVCRPLKQDPRADVVPHTRLQLEVGALAAMAGHRVQFERPIPHSSKTSDVTIGLHDGERLIVEARVILQDERTATANAFTDRAFRAIQNIGSRYQVECIGELTEVLDEAALGALLDTVEMHARLVHAGGVAPPLLLHGAALQVTRRGEAHEKALRGPALTGDLWPRIADRLAQKAHQTLGGERVWLRICALQGLWLFTHWGTLALPEKLASMRHNIISQLAGHPHVDGVVISSAAAWPQGTVEPDEHEDELGGYALRCAIPPMLARETLVVPLRADAACREHARVWRDLYASEPDWLDRALARFGLPEVADIFAFDADLEERPD